MTIARNPGAWYWALQTYKGAQFRENALTLGALAYRWLKTHRPRIVQLLGGDVDFATIVPSKRVGVTYETQPLRLALELVQPLAKRLQQTLRCDQGNRGGHMKYAPQIFIPVDRDSISGSRIILIEDTWITGGTAMSAAGALLDAGARSVVVTPIARDFKIEHHGTDHPYAAYLNAPYDIHSWPRD